VQQYVADTLTDWHIRVAQQYDIDGFRVDAAQHVDEVRECE
jgi:glycosidase